MYVFDAGKTKLINLLNAAKNQNYFNIKCQMICCFYKGFLKIALKYTALSTQWYELWYPVCSLAILFIEITDSTDCSAV